MSTNANKFSKKRDTTYLVIVGTATILCIRCEKFSVYAGSYGWWEGVGGVFVILQWSFLSFFLLFVKSILERRTYYPFSEVPHRKA